MFLLGPMGIGKSTAAKAILLHLATASSEISQLSSSVIPLFFDLSNGSGFTGGPSRTAFAQRFCLMLLFAKTFRHIPILDDLLGLQFSVLDVLEYVSERFKLLQQPKPCTVVFVVDEIQLFTANQNEPPTETEWRECYSSVGEGMCDDLRCSGQFGFVLVPVLAGAIPLCSCSCACASLLAFPVLLMRMSCVVRNAQFRQPSSTFEIHRGSQTSPTLVDYCNGGAAIA
jgi:hypothetical protein